MYCGRTGRELSELTEQNYNNYVKLAADLCKDYSAADECPNDQEKAPSCNASPTKEEYCAGLPTPIRTCTSDTDCQLLPCFSTCYPCKSEELCNKYVDLGLLANSTAKAKKKQCYSNGAGSLSATIMGTVLMAIVAVLVM
eukprot:comp17241_c0_seq1/m.28757 comp17241_c0_seq1/g.28757  ORF comp17241_c0_seq1/g.28757 comp17241_c0_seq1/m.28757 type:complete len:140 (-) comp17241_c0_seq1:31-450(-)